MNFWCKCGCVLVLALVAVSCDNEPLCPEGKCWCWAECIECLADKDNCGQCGNQCGLHSECVGGNCVCKEGYTDCGGNCVNLNFDTKNCGRCGNECDWCEPCAYGNCAASGCPLPFVECPGPDGCPICVDLETDDEHCGACGNECGGDSYCLHIKCCYEGDCLGANIICEVSDDCPVCVDTETDNDHCGICNNACADWEACCQGTCEDISSDNDNCGACGKTCGYCEQCIGGVCNAMGCCPPNVVCGTDCVNLEVNNNHCGACDNACSVPSGFICQGGECICIGGLTECGDPLECVDLQTDPEHCGSCDNSCGWCGVCSYGNCVIFDCLPPNFMCLRPNQCPVCVDPLTDNTNCGASDPCAFNPGVECSIEDGFVCQNGVCACLPGWTDCGGYCADLMNDPDNCSACGVVCDSPWPLPCECNNGACYCPSCYADCDGDPENGTETEICNDENNCGECGNICTDGSTCSEGACQCGEYLTFCEEDGICVDLDCDENNCGICSNSCAQGEECIGGLCAAWDYYQNPEIFCDEYQLPLSGTTQCTAIFYPPCEWHQSAMDVTDLVEWIEDDPNSIIESIVDGFVTISDTGSIGDFADIYAEYGMLSSNSWRFIVIP